MCLNVHIAVSKKFSILVRIWFLLHPDTQASRDPESCQIVQGKKNNCILFYFIGHTARHVGSFKFPNQKSNLHPPQWNHQGSSPEHFSSHIINLLLLSFRNITQTYFLPRPLQIINNKINITSIVSGASQRVYYVQYVQYTKAYIWNLERW